MVRQHPRDVIKTSPPPYDRPGLERIALDYVGRYATTRGKLTAYLRRKLRERGWAGEDEPPVEALVARFADFGYVNDAAFAEARTDSLLRRGYGGRRIAANLGAAGIDRATTEGLRDRIDAAADDAALAFARRRRLGPFSTKPQDVAEKRRSMAAMMRAGHAPATAARILALVVPEEEVD